MLGNLASKLTGYKTYITAGIGILTVVVAHFFGPLTIAGTTLPPVSTDEMWKSIWEGIMAVTIRHGVSTSSNPTQGEKPQ